MMKKIALILFMLLSLLIATGCTDILIETDVDYPTGLFKDAMKKINAIQAKDPQRKGKVSRLNLLVYIGEDRDVFRFSVKTDTAEQFIKNTGGSDNKEIKKYAGKFKDVDLDKFKDLDRLGPGLVTEIKVKDDNIHLLVWLD
ncbi:MAG: hypothetical protein GY950_15955 [bacterium]|nr:hypothetical protein [bacterium]